MKAPTSLKGEAKKFFTRHASRCAQDGTLTEATLDSFLLLCRTWAVLDAIDTENDPKGLLSWNGTLKSFERYAKQFRLFSNKVPTENKTDITQIIQGRPCLTARPS